MKEVEDVQRAQQNVTQEKKKLETFDTEVQNALQEVAARYDSDVQLERVSLAPRRGQVQVLFVGLGWKATGNAEG
jgi:hypothetical protein